MLLNKETIVELHTFIKIEGDDYACLKPYIAITIRRIERQTPKTLKNNGINILTFSTAWISSSLQYSFQTRN